MSRTVLFQYILLIFVFGANVVSAEQGDPARDRAVVLLNSSKYKQAVSALQELLRSNNHDFYTYSLLWQALDHIEGPGPVADEVRKDVALLSGVAQQDRTELFYGTYQDGLERLGREKEALAVRQQEITAFPAGNAARYALLQQAEQEPAPAEKALLYENLCNQFSQIIPFVATAQRERFQVIQTNPGVFPLHELIASAAEWSRSEKNASLLSGSVVSYINALYMISESFVASAPKTAIEYENAAIKYITAMKPSADTDRAGLEADFLPLELQSKINAKAWAEARLITEQLLPYFEQGRLSQNVPITSEQEAQLRSEIGIVFEHCGDLNGAFLQYGIASALQSQRIVQLSAFIAAHRQFDVSMDRMRSQWRADIDSEVQQRNVYLEKATAKNEVYLKAAPFDLMTLSNRTVSLQSFHGRPLILVFWASWCHYCSQELDELKSLQNSAASGSFAILAVTVDTDHKAAIAFTKDKYLPFDIAFSNGLIESSYHATVIPQMVIIDPNGYIRFQVAGTQLDFGHSIRYMLEDSNSAKGAMALR